MKHPKNTATLSFSREDLQLGGIETINLRNAGISFKGSSIVSKDSKDYEAIKGRISAGLFGSNGDPNKFYPGLTAANVIPKPEDFIKAPFRLLTATIVGGESWKATDFSDEAVLKASTQLLNGVTVFTDHNQDTDNWVGLVDSPVWQAATTLDGNKIPGGINGTLMIDAVTNPKIARGVLMGAIYSNSVTVSFEWEPSHTFEDAWEFYDKIGTFHKDGKMICRKVTKILAYYETSLVWMGADPYSKSLDEQGLPKNVDASSVYSKEVDTIKEQYEKEKSFSTFAKIEKGLVSLSRTGLTKEAHQEEKQEVKTSSFMKKFLTAFIAAFGPDLKLSFTSVEGEELTPEQETEAITALSKLKTGVGGNAATPEQLQAAQFANSIKTVDEAGKIVSLAIPAKEDKTEYVAVPVASFNAIRSLSDFGKEQLDAQRQEAIRLYKLSAGDKVNEGLVSLISNSEGEALKGFLAQYGKSATDEFTAICTKCGDGDNVEMRSSFDTSKNDGGKGDKDEIFIPSFGDLSNKYGNGNSLFR